MNKQLKTLFVLAFAMVMSVTSCLNENEDTNSGAAKLPSNVASLADQVEAMISSVVEIEAIQSSLTEMSDLQATASHFETCAAMIEEHIASIESGVTGVPAVVAAMARETHRVHGLALFCSGCIENQWFQCKWVCSG